MTAFVPIGLLHIRANAINGLGSVNKDFPPETIRLIQQALTKMGLSNPILQSGILAVVSTEGSFYPKRELSYRNTPNDRLRTIFTKRLDKYNEAQLTELKKDDVKFYDAVYGGEFGAKYGNTSPGDGFKYRGGGFNQITFKNLFKKYGDMIGVDLVNNPERINEIPVAALALAAYFKDGFEQGKRSGLLKKKIGVDDVSQITDLQTATRAAMQTNAGWGTNVDGNTWLKQHLQNQINNVQELYNIVKSNLAQVVQRAVTKTTQVVKENPVATIALVGGIGVVAVTAYFLFFRKPEPLKEAA